MSDINKEVEAAALLLGLQEAERQMKSDRLKKIADVNKHNNGMKLRRSCFHMRMKRGWRAPGPGFKFAGN